MVNRTEKTLEHEGPRWVRRRVLGVHIVIWAFPKIKDTFFLGVPKLRVEIYRGLYWGSPYVGEVPCCGPGFGVKGLRVAVVGGLHLCRIGGFSV